jgi:HEPN domain-containing protein
MAEFNKIKIPFALALLAAMFALNPLVNKYGEIAYLVFGFSVSINSIYLIFCSLLGASVYFYAIGLVGEKAIFEVANKIGHVTYAFALIVPPLFLFLYPVSLAAEIVVKFTQSPAFSNVIEYSLSGFVGIAASLISNFIIKTFSQRDKTEKVKKLSEQENQFLARANELFKQGYFDLAVTESWKAVEIALNKTFISIGEKRYPKNMRLILELAEKRKILKNNQVADLKMILRIRNNAVHTEEHIDSSIASNVLGISEKIIASLAGASESCYFCDKYFHTKDLETENMTGASVCAECAKKNPNWKDELIAMGMDT